MSPAELKARAKRRQYAIQAVILVGTIAIVWSAVSSAQTNLSALGITSGFGFLDRSTGWSYSFSLLERNIDDSYARTLTIGFLNTLFVGGVSIILATILGFIVGTARDMRNLALASAANVFVQIFRNIPLILQAVFWYAIMIHMPGPRQAYSLGEAAFLSNRGLMLPTLNLSLGAAAILLLTSLALAAFLVWRKTSLMRALALWIAGVLALAIASAITLVPADETIFSVPELRGLRFVGGLTVSIELVAMIVSIVLYGSAYIAEVVRGGLKEVPKGLVEAGQALGLSPASIWSRIKLPMALRTIIPPLGNQWIFIMKATTIGVAIGFSDLFYIVSTSITQSGQTLELIAILMGAFLLINFTLAQFVNWLNARLQLKAH
ncbi:ABC transporter permease subunit [Thalassococcus sp. S3]|uniref:ABC transporter permease subunit n=1 Tax=Thalassococcus sp. S3 TaxID=2017482 RepID=UPI0013EE433B|nr:ABC transporter permease subunit [Thalassococcus sp. S3]